MNKYIITFLFSFISFSVYCQQVVVNTDLLNSTIKNGVARASSNSIHKNALLRTKKYQDNIKEKETLILAYNRTIVDALYKVDGSLSQLKQLKEISLMLLDTPNLINDFSKVADQHKLYIPSIINWLNTIKLEMIALYTDVSKFALSKEEMADYHERANFIDKLYRRVRLLNSDIQTMTILLKYNANVRNMLYNTLPQVTFIFEDQAVINKIINDINYLE